MKIEEYRIGNTQIEIHDDAFVAQEEINFILTRIANIAKNGLQPGKCLGKCLA